MQTGWAIALKYAERALHEEADIPPPPLPPPPRQRAASSDLSTPVKALATELDGLLRTHTRLCVMSYQEQGLGPQFTF